MAPVHVRSKVCIAPFHVRSKVCKFTPKQSFLSVFPHINPLNQQSWQKELNSAQRSELMKNQRYLELYFTPAKQHCTRTLSVHP